VRKLIEEAQRTLSLLEHPIEADKGGMMIFSPLFLYMFLMSI
jgi:hypothetical protein